MTDYDDDDGRVDRHRLIAVAKPNIGEPAVRSCFGRNAFIFDPDSLNVKIAGLHGYDRDYADVSLSDRLRTQQIGRAIDYLTPGDTQAILLGDINSMHPEVFNARLLRALTPLAMKLPSGQPGEIQTKLMRAGSIAQRLTQMAVGGPITELESRGFRSSDPSNETTMPIGPIGIQLDHIMGRNIEMRAHEVHNFHPLSDHYAVSATAEASRRQN